MKKNKKIINCVACPKFCLKDDLSGLKKLLSEFKKQGYDGVEFNCQAGKKMIKDNNLI